jgi:predicted DNA-binding transcriptional regulator YafY
MAAPFGLSQAIRLRLQLFREAVEQRRKTIFQYADAKHQLTERSVSPLGCFFWGEGWTLLAWCDARQDFRTFRIDRIMNAQITDKNFELEREKSISAYLHRSDITLDGL